MTWGDVKMIEIRIPKEIRSYKEKLFFGLTLRQTICTVLALGINIPLYIYVRPLIGDDLASWIIICTGMPIFLIGYFKFNGMPFEQFVLCIFTFEVVNPKKRKYKTENLFNILLAVHEKEEELIKKKQSGLFHRPRVKKNKKDKRGESSENN
jgi:hypothetical protein